MNDAVKRMLQRYQVENWQDYERALREILQEIALVALWRARFFEQAAFYGGTALRILYGLDRFSEDLDFTLLRYDDSFLWASFASKIAEEIRSYGFEVNVNDKNKNNDSGIRSAFLKANTLQSLLSIGISKDNIFGLNPDKLMKIKIEIDVNPTMGFEVEKKYVKEPLPVAITAVKESDLFAAKLHAALFRASTLRGRVKGRDWYDVIWFIRRGVLMNSSYFRICMQKLNGWDQQALSKPEDVISLAVERIEEIDISSAKQDVMPFLKDSSIVEEWSKKYFQDWVKQIQFI